ncbi:hypothetical protein FBU30_004132 [Linnemannia zychae]|nr:hypothetical protein FBU30_004132 [Linnemannia zychae]
MALLGQRFEHGSIQRELDIVASINSNEPGFIYADDVLDVFKIPYADRFEANGRSLCYMRDDKGIMYHPKRIPCRPASVIRVIYEPPPKSASNFSGSSVTPPTSIDESVDQLNIGNNVSTHLDSSEPLHVHLPRRSTAHIQNGLFSQGEMIQQNVQRIFDQGTITQKIAQEILTFQKQKNDRLLAEYPIPRLFIVLPEELVKYDPANWFRTKFRLHFICECGKHTETKDSKVSHQLHLAKHEGYTVREPTEFFKKFGPFLLLMLEMIKAGTNIASHVVPALATLKMIELTDTIKLSVDVAREMINYSLNCIDNQLIKITESSLRDSVNAEPYAVSTRRDLTDYLSNIEGLEVVELRQLGSFLKTSSGDNLLGNLYRMTTSDGHVKWVCRDHYRAGYHEKYIHKLRDVIKVAGGEYDEQLGKITITLTSNIAADEFYDALSKAKGVLEINMCWNWGCTSSDFKHLEVVLKNAGVTSLQIDINQFHSSRGDGFLSTSIKNSEAFTIRGLEALSKAISVNWTLTTLTLSNNIIGDSRLQMLSKALKSNTALTGLGLRNNCITDNGAQELSLILKSNSTLISLDLGDNFITNNGAKSLFKALMTNSTLKNLDLRNNIFDVELQMQSNIIKTSLPLKTLYLNSNYIGNNGAQVLSEALKINSTLITLSLEQNSIGYSGAQSLSEALKINSTLTTLNLGENSISDSGAQSLSEALKINSNVTILSPFDKNNRDNRQMDYQ